MRPGARDQQGRKKSGDDLFGPGRLGLSGLGIVTASCHDRVNMVIEGNKLMAYDGVIDGDYVKQITASCRAIEVKMSDQFVVSI
jgi:hypothetical protein